jgi:hypothetical protein
MMAVLALTEMRAHNTLADGRLIPFPSDEWWNCSLCSRMLFRVIAISRLADA